MRHDTSPKDADPKLKGKFDGNCNRTDCQKSIKGNNFWNSSTRAYYCEECSNGYQGINYWSQRDDGIIICTPVMDKDDKPAFPYEEYRKIQAEKDAKRAAMRARLG